MAGQAEGAGAIADDAGISVVTFTTNAVVDAQEARAEARVGTRTARGYAVGIMAGGAFHFVALTAVIGV